jgi:Xaa-Pro aminopeptidase
VDEVRNSLKKDGVSYLIVTALDEIAWLLNLRGNDISFNPLFFSYVLVGPETLHLYIDQQRGSWEEAVQSLHHELGNQLRVEAYSKFHAGIAEMADTLYDTNSGRIKHSIALDPHSCNLGVKILLPPTTVVERSSPIKGLKSVKTEEEIEGMKQCHIRDGKAVVKFLAWLDKQLKSIIQEAASRSQASEMEQSALERQLCEERSLTEYNVAQKLKSFREEIPEFQSLSFDTISSTGSNGAIIHYSPTQNNSSVIELHSLYLCDSGGQYLNGTTDM